MQPKILPRFSVFQSMVSIGPENLLDVKSKVTGDSAKYEGMEDESENISATHMNSSWKYIPRAHVCDSPEGLT
jgi:hypothetical protein